MRPAFGHADPAGHWRRRLQEGLAHNLELVIAKAVRGQLALACRRRDHPAGRALRAPEPGRLGHRPDDPHGASATCCRCCRRRKPTSPCSTAPAGSRRTARPAAAAGARPARQPARSGDAQAVAAALDERCGIGRRPSAPCSPRSPLELRRRPWPIFCSRPRRTASIADGGHLLDFINKACECLDLIGWEHAAAVLPSVVGQLVTAQGAEEATAWRHPIDLVSLCEESTKELPQPARRARPAEKPGQEHAALAEALLGDDPDAILEALKAAVRAGASPADLGALFRLCGGAPGGAVRDAQRALADWETAHHVFTYTNAVHQI